MSHFSASFSTVYPLRILKGGKGLGTSSFGIMLIASNLGTEGARPLTPTGGQKTPEKRFDWFGGCFLNQLPWTKGRGNMIGQTCVTYTHQEGGVGSSFQRRQEYFFQEGRKVGRQMKTIDRSPGDAESLNMWGGEKKSFQGDCHHLQEAFSDSLISHFSFHPINSLAYSQYSTRHCVLLSVSSW